MAVGTAKGAARSAPVVWVLTDDRPGNANQALGVADALGFPYEIKRLAYNRLAALPNALLGASTVHLRADSAAALALASRDGGPDLVIAAGRRAAPVARAVHRSSGGRARLVQIMRPGWPAVGIDLIVAPEHDDVPDSPSVMHTIGAPNRVSRDRMAEAAAIWGDRLGAVPAPRLAVLVGGDTGRTRFAPAHARELAATARNRATALGASLLVSTSRRTAPASIEALMAALGPIGHSHIWRPGGEDNPYLAYLALADEVIVTGDSASMCTEACSTGKPVRIFAPMGWAPAKIARLHRRLYDGGHAWPLDAGEGVDTPPPARLDEAALVAKEIRRRFAFG